MTPCQPSAIDPLNPWRSFEATITKVQSEVPSVLTFELRLQDQEVADRYRFIPGQFNMLYVPGCGEVAISLSGSPDHGGDQIVHTIRVVGRVTEAIENLQAGDVLGLRGPFGSTWPIDACRDRDVLLVAGGLGLAPLRPLIYHFCQHRTTFRRIQLLYGSRSPDWILYYPELPFWRDQGIEVELTVDRADESWSGNVGVVPLLIDRIQSLDPTQTTVVMCGPEVMMHYSAIGCLRRRIPAESIWLSMERNMQCAVGFCGHCQLGPHFVCKNGPVFRYDQLESWMRIRDL